MCFSPAIILGASCCPVLWCPCLRPSKSLGDEAYVNTLVETQEKQVNHFCLNTTYKIATKINVGNCSLTKSND